MSIQIGARTVEVHPDITPEAILDAIQRREGAAMDNPGLCLSCGQEQDGCEPDARGYKCENCGETLVFAPEELLMMGLAG